jgi:hypothetical protein
MRKGLAGLSMLVQQVLAEDPFSGAPLCLLCAITVQIGHDGTLIRQCG